MFFGLIVDSSKPGKFDEANIASPLAHFSNVVLVGGNDKPTLLIAKVNGTEFIIASLN